MDYKDYYQILGITKQATEADIKKAYRKLARKYHPDVNTAADAEDRFKEINEAYEVLGSADSRAKYDQLGGDWNRWQQGGGQPDDFDWSFWQTAPNGPRVYSQYGDLGGMSGEYESIFGNGFGQSNGGFSDFFEAIFGGQSRAEQYTNGGATSYAAQPLQEIVHDVDISLTEAYQGSERLIDIDGRRLSVKFPAGAKTGTKIRIRGQKDSTTTHQPDLFLRITVAADPRFRREVHDLHTTVSTDLYTAVLGGDVIVPTLAGEVKLKIPAGTQPGQNFRLRGKGMPKLQAPNQPGDLFAQIVVEIPAKLGTKQTALFKQLQGMST
ncbi:MAG: J domain-containing protein [Chloroflexota bacterium]